MSQWWNRLYSNCSLNDEIQMMIVKVIILYIKKKIIKKGKKLLVFIAVVWLYKVCNYVPGFVFLIQEKLLLPAEKALTPNPKETDKQKHPE